MAFTVLTKSLRSYLLSPFSELLEKVDYYSKNNITFGGDFNFIFDCKFDASGEKPILGKASLAKLIEIRETPYWRDIWRIQNTNARRFTFPQNHISGFTE